MRHIYSAVVLLAGCAALLPAQTTQTMRASIRGGGSGDSGKCTIEVEVDGVADVEVRGDTGYLRTLQGQPATWRRFECTSVIPRNPADFQFRGVDGRGNVQLVRDPRNAGAAVVRVEDPKAGRESYTFDLEWRGGNGGGYSNNTPYNGNNAPYNGNNPRNDPYYDGRRYDPNYRDDPSYSGRNANGYNDPGQMVGVCQDEVRARASRQYGVRDPRFTGSNVDDRRGDRIVGSFQGYRGERYDYACTVNSGRVRNVEIWRR